MNSPERSLLAVEPLGDGKPQQRHNGREEIHNAKLLLGARLNGLPRGDEDPLHAVPARSGIRWRDHFIGEELRRAYGHDPVRWDNKNLRSTIERLAPVDLLLAIDQTPSGLYTFASLRLAKMNVKRSLQLRDDLGDERGSIGRLDAALGLAPFEIEIDLPHVAIRIRPRSRPVYVLRREKDAPQQIVQMAMSQARPQIEQSQALRPDVEVLWGQPRPPR
jgi:hypothetical protein